MISGLTIKEGLGVHNLSLLSFHFILFYFFYYQDPRGKQPMFLCLFDK
jgi:hypothetical protein